MTVVMMYLVCMYVRNVTFAARTYRTYVRTVCMYFGCIRSYIHTLYIHAYIYTYIHVRVLTKFRAEYLP